jgi:hypothetical protein
VVFAACSDAVLDPLISQPRAQTGGAAGSGGGNGGSAGGAGAGGNPAGSGGVAGSGGAIAGQGGAVGGAAGAAGIVGMGGTAGVAGAAGSGAIGGTAGNGGNAGIAGMGGAAGVAGNGGTGGVGGNAGNAGTSGVGGAAGGGGAGGAAAGTGGTGGTAGGAGTGGAGGNGGSGGSAGAPLYMLKFSGGGLLMGYGQPGETLTGSDTEIWTDVSDGSQACFVTFTIASFASDTACPVCTFGFQAQLVNGVMQAGDCTKVGYSSLATSQRSPLHYSYEPGPGGQGTLWVFDGAAWSSQGLFALSGDLVTGADVSWSSP